MAQDDKFTPQGKFRHDPKRTRATFGVRYPGTEVVFAATAEIPHHQKIVSKRLVFTVQRQNVEDVEFAECNFHNRHGIELSVISSLTFNGCRFHRSFMGTTTYTHCRFRRCAFTRCDFSFAEFKDCLFEECEFVECTAGNCVFERTEIDPNSLMKGLRISAPNLDGQADITISAARAQLDDVRFRVASALLRSSVEVSNRFYSDAALRHQKREELTYRAARIRSGGIARGAIRALGLAWATIVYHTTSGGTSLARPALLTAAVVVAYGVLLAYGCASYAGVALNQLDLGSRVIAATSLVLGFGFTNFSACSRESLTALVAGSCSGIVLLALTASVIVRRVYR